MSASLSLNSLIVCKMCKRLTYLGHWDWFRHCVNCKFYKQNQDRKKYVENLWKMQKIWLGAYASLWWLEGKGLQCWRSLQRWRVESNSWRKDLNIFNFFTGKRKIVFPVICLKCKRVDCCISFLLREKFGVCHCGGTWARINLKSWKPDRHPKLTDW